MKRFLVMIPETDEERRNHDPLHLFVNMDGRLTNEGELLVGLTFEVMGQACFRNAKAHGWWENSDRNFGEVCMLFTSEIAEAFEAYRDGDDPTQIKYLHNPYGEAPFVNDEPELRWGDGQLGKPEGIAAELADVLIRIFDTAGSMGIPLGEATIRKHLYNFDRPYRHGNKLA